MFSIREDSLGLSRRDWLRVGGVSALGLSLSARAKAESKPMRNCIFLFLAGGPPQHETWDPKPDAPAEIRGDIGSITTKLPGVRVGELMPRLAAQIDRWCVLRALSTNDNAHASSGYWMLTGVPHLPSNTDTAKPGPPNDWPSLGAIVRKLRRDRYGLPASITLPERIINNPNNPWPGQTGGFLGRAADPWLLTCDPSARPFQIPEFGLPDDVPPLRFDGRRALFDQVNQHLDLADRAVAGKLDEQRQQAFDLLRSPQARRAFDLEREPAATRDRYGRHKFGQGVLLARRLIEAGVSLVQVNWPREPGDTTSNAPLWDTHAKNSERLRQALMPPMDQAVSTLIDDLAARGLLGETLVVWAGEFGRTPKINASGGRDHWGHVFSAALAGGGVRGGQVIGASDKIGGQAKAHMVQPQDLAATIFHCLGYSADTQINDLLNRPVAVSNGRIIQPALS